MFTRMKILLALLAQANKPLHPVVLAHLVFLIRHETDLEEDPTFYDFVPYKYGPFSFSLYQELSRLERDGYVTLDEEWIVLSVQAAGQAEEKINELPLSVLSAVDKIIQRYGKKSQAELKKDVYSRYPWFATKSELSDLGQTRTIRAKKAKPAVYTAGYEGKSVDAFFNHLLEHGIELIIDVRANPVSRSYGFSRKQFSEIASQLGIDYQHVPELGIPRKYRTNLADLDAHQQLLMKYEKQMLPRIDAEVYEIGKLMQGTPAVLVCVEKDVQCCHRSRLAEAVARKTGLEVKHI